MAIGPFGRLAIGPTGAQVTFTCDPRTYRPWQWPKRKSVHPGLGGSVTIQEFGTYQKDNVVEIESPVDAFMEDTVVAEIHAMFRTKGAVYLLTDWVGSSFTVWIEEFLPEPNEQLPGYSYRMKLRVLGINTLFGEPYSGS